MIDGRQAADAVRQLLANGLVAPVIERRPTITGNQVFVAFGVFKAGPAESIGRELAIYEDLRNRLGDVYESIFPVATLRQRDERMAIIELPFLGRALPELFEKPIDAHALTPVSANHLTSCRNLALAEKGIAWAVHSLEKIFDRTYQYDDTVTRNFVSELLVALRANLTRAALLPELEAELRTVESESLMWSDAVPTSCCHRDLMIDHIFFADADPTPVYRLADPRCWIPHADSTEFSDVQSITSMGSLAADFAHLEVSLVRHTYELQRLAPHPRLTWLEHVRNTITEWTKVGRFTHQLYQLALATWYANYAGWPESLGPAPPPDKRPLFELMIREARAQLLYCARLTRA